MKKIILSMSAIVLSLSIMAQEQKTTAPTVDKKEQREGRHEKRKEMFEKLNLTADQQAKMKAINDDSRKEMKQLEGQSLTEAERKEKRQTIMAARKEKVNAILTDEQRKQMATMKPMGDGRKDRGEKFEKMAKDLNLTPEQTAKMKTLQTSLDGKMKDLKGNTTLSDEQRKAEMKSLMKSHKASIEQILTADQLKQLNEKRKKHPHPDAPTK